MVTEPCQVSPFPTTFDILCNLFGERIRTSFTVERKCLFRHTIAYQCLSLSLKSCTSLPGACLDMGKRILQPLRISKVASSERRRQIKGIVHAG